MAEAAKRVGVTPSYLRRLAREGKIDVFKVGHQWVTTEEAVSTYRAHYRKRGPKPTRE